MLLPQPEVRYAFTGRSGYMFPRADGIVLGGTFELDVWSAEAEPETIARIVAAHRRLFAGAALLDSGARPAIFGREQQGTE